MPTLSTLPHDLIFQILLESTLLSKPWTTTTSLSQVSSSIYSVHTTHEALLLNSILRTTTGQDYPHAISLARLSTCPCSYPHRQGRQEGPDGSQLLSIHRLQEAIRTHHRLIILSHRLCLLPNITYPPHTLLTSLYLLSLNQLPPNSLNRRILLDFTYDLSPDFELVQAVNQLCFQVAIIVQRMVRYVVPGRPRANASKRRELMEALYGFLFERRVGWERLQDIWGDWGVLGVDTKGAWERVGELKFEEEWDEKMVKEDDWDMDDDDKMDWTCIIVRSWDSQCLIVGFRDFKVPETARKPVFTTGAE